MHPDMVDETLDSKDYTAEEAKRIIEISLMCTQSYAALRPPMSEVVVLLRSISKEGSLEHPPPTKPAYVDSYSRVRGETVDFDRKIRRDTSTATRSSSSNAASIGSATSNATVSISQLSGR